MFTAATTIFVSTAATAAIVVVVASPEARERLARKGNVLAGDMLATIAGADLDTGPAVTEWRIRPTSAERRGVW